MLSDVCEDFGVAGFAWYAGWCGALGAVALGKEVWLTCRFTNVTTENVIDGFGEIMFHLA